MCRLFYAYNVPYMKKKIQDFLQQSDHEAKHTPGLNSPSDYITHMDGFGLAWFNIMTHRWKSLKSPKLYKQVQSLDTKINDIRVSNLVVGHIRRQSGDAAPAMENTHPFTYRNQLFIHNGYLDGFHRKRETMLRDMHYEYRNHVVGDTDTECMFYLYLTFKRQRENRALQPHLANDQSPDTICVLAMTDLFAYLRTHFSRFNANIIYANKSYSIISRYSFSREGGLVAPSLYINGELERGKLLITSEPIMETWTLIPNHTLFVVKHTEGEYYAVNLHT